MDQITSGLKSTAAYMDDVIVTGRTIEEHNNNLEALLSRIQQFGFHLRIEKCRFAVPSLNYLGFIISAEGRKLDPMKIKAIVDMPVPKDLL